MSLATKPIRSLGRNSPPTIARHPGCRASRQQFRAGGDMATDEVPRRSSHRNVAQILGRGIGFVSGGGFFDTGQRVVGGHLRVNRYPGCVRGCADQYQARQARGQFGSREEVFAAGGVPDIHRMIDGLGSFEQHPRPQAIGISWCSGSIDVGAVSGQVDQPHPAGHVDGVDKLMQALRTDSRTAWKEQPVQVAGCGRLVGAAEPQTASTARVASPWRPGQ